MQGNTDHAKGWVQECVDHHIFRADDGKWHLWGCIRGTAIGRVLYHWVADNLTDEHWTQTGEMIRADVTAGESPRLMDDQEWLQSPFIIQANGQYYMFYGGHSTEWTMFGRASDLPLFETQQENSAGMRGQICLMTSPDGLRWTRYKNRQGYSRVFVGPGETRDPMLLQIDGVWHMYYAGAMMHPTDGIMAQVYVSTSDDLLHWSEWIPVHYDYDVLDESQRAKNVWTHECPFVVEREGYFYLFRTENYWQRWTHVYRSEDPLDFGLGGAAAKGKYLGKIAVAAPEIVTDENGAQFMSSNHNLSGGTMLCRLKWIDDEE